MPRNPSKLYKHHVANLRELDIALSNVARLARSAIASGDPQRSLRTLLRMYSLLVGAWAECRLRKLLHEELGFNDAERSHVQSQSTQLEQWQETINLAFRKHYNIRKAPLNEHVLGVAGAARLGALQKVLTNELRIVIELRNKLAHGQWIYPLNNEGTAVEPEKYQLINKENLQSLQYKLALSGHLADAVHDLVVSPRAFERDFETHFRKLYQVQTNLRAKSYAKYEAALIASRRRSREKSLKPSYALLQSYYGFYGSPACTKMTKSLSASEDSGCAGSSTPTVLPLGHTPLLVAAPASVGHWRDNPVLKSWGGQGSAP
jgi:hypothetical protein